MIRFLDPVAALGRVTLNLVSVLGELGLFTASAIVGLLRPPFYPRNFSRAFAEIGFFSLPVVAMIGRTPPCRINTQLLVVRHPVRARLPPLA